MLEKLFGSKTRYKILARFVSSPSEEFFVRELTRDTGEQINSVRRELENLRNLGLLKTRLQDNKKFYAINTKSRLYPGVQDLIFSYLTTPKNIAKELSALGHIDMLVLNGLFADNPRAPFDILVVSDILKSKLEETLDSIGQRIGREIRTAALDKQEFMQRYHAHDKFVLDVFRDTTNIFAIRKLLV